MDAVTEAHRYAHDRRAATLGRLVSLIRYPTVSADPRRAADLTGCAGWLARLLYRQLAAVAGRAQGPAGLGGPLGAWGPVLAHRQLSPDGLAGRGLVDAPLVCQGVHQHEAEP